LEIKAELFASQWFLTLFAYDFTIETAAKILDLFLVFEWKIIHKLALSLISLSYSIFTIKVII